MIIKNAKIFDEHKGFQIGDIYTEKDWIIIERIQIYR